MYTFLCLNFFLLTLLLWCLSMLHVYPSAIYLLSVRPPACLKCWCCFGPCEPRAGRQEAGEAGKCCWVTGYQMPCLSRSKTGCEEVQLRTQRLSRWEASRETASEPPVREGRKRDAPGPFLSLEVLSVRAGTVASHPSLANGGARWKRSAGVAVEGRGTRDLRYHEARACGGRAEGEGTWLFVLLSFALTAASPRLAASPDACGCAGDGTEYIPPGSPELFLGEWRRK